MKPQISIIMSVYNGEDYLAETIESVIAQTFKNWELVVINDCSTDKTAEILADFALKDERIKVHTNEVNLRLPKSLNKAISLSEGKYIARMDADDICLPERFEKQYKFMEENGDVDLSSCRFLTLKNGVYASGGNGGRCDNESLKAMLLVMNPILHPGVIARAEVLKEINYDETLTCTEDLELWTRLVMKNKKLQILPEYLLIYRLHNKQITSTTLERQHTEVLKIENKYYSSLANQMSDEMQKFYIGGVYFKEEANIDKFCNFVKWLKKNNKNIDKNSLYYALLEILAEYKRCGISKKDIVRGSLSFDAFFLVKEFLRRKKAAKAEIEKCRMVANELGLKPAGGTRSFPFYTK